LCKQDQTLYFAQAKQLQWFFSTNFSTQLLKSYGRFCKFRENPANVTRRAPSAKNFSLSFVLNQQESLARSDRSQIFFRHNFSRTL